MLEKDCIKLMLSLPNSHYEYKSANFSGSFYFETDNVEKLWNQIKNKANICYEIETFVWGMREFAIFDNNGYILRFGQEVD